jgi:hypothetical protein
LYSTSSSFFLSSFLLLLFFFYCCFHVTLHFTFFVAWWKKGTQKPIRLHLHFARFVCARLAP